jgi:hypothetical protein
MADNAKIEGNPPPANTTKKWTPALTVEERQQVVSQLMIGCTWVEDAPELDKKAVTCMAKDFNKHVATIWRVWHHFGMVRGGGDSGFGFEEKYG